MAWCESVEDVVHLEQLAAHSNRLLNMVQEAKASGGGAPQSLLFEPPPLLAITCIPSLAPSPVPIHATRGP